MKVQLTRIERSGANLKFVLVMNGFIGVFRIYFTDKSRKNAVHSDLHPIHTYFEGYPSVENTGKAWNIPVSTNISAVTDACLFVERKTQWILEILDRQEVFEKNME